MDKKSTLSLLSIAYQFNSDLINELQEDDFEVLFFDLLQNSDEIITDQIINILVSIMNTENPEITQLLILQI